MGGAAVFSSCVTAAAELDDLWPNYTVEVQDEVWWGCGGERLDAGLQ